MMGGSFAILIFWAISIAIFYYVIKAAVKSGVKEANQELLDTVLAIERKLESRL